MVTLSPALDSYPKYKPLAFARRSKTFCSCTSKSSLISHIRCLKQIIFKRRGSQKLRKLPSWDSRFFSEPHLGIRIFSEFPFDAKKTYHVLLLQKRLTWWASSNRLNKYWFHKKSLIEKVVGLLFFLWATQPYTEHS